MCCVFVCSAIARPWCEYAVKIKDLSLDQPVDIYATRASWLLIFNFLGYTQMLHLSGSAQCLPLFGSALVLAFFTIGRSDKPGDGVAKLGEGDNEPGKGDADEL